METLLQTKLVDATTRDRKMGYTAVPQHPQQMQTYKVWQK